MKTKRSKRLVEAILELNDSDVAVTQCPDCGKLEYRMTEIRSESDPDFLIVVLYECANCGSSGDSGVSEHRPLADSPPHRRKVFTKI